jgi:hypothetical protein
MLPRASVTSPGGWLLFADEHGVAAAIAARLGQSGVRVTTVVRGKEFSRIGEGSFVINPEVRDDYDRLLAELNAADAVPASSFSRRRSVIFASSSLSSSGWSPTASMRSPENPCSGPIE